MTFRHHLAAELERRCRRNRRYSLRAYSRALGVDHSTLSQVMRGARRLTANAVHRMAPRIGLAPSQTTLFAIEARLLQIVTRRTFQPRSSELARRLGISVDDVNVILQRLLRTGQLRMQGRKWEVA